MTAILPLAPLTDSAAPALDISLNLIAELARAGLRIVPDMPDEAMIQAAVRAGAPDAATAVRIYAAMVHAGD
ncbi:MAG: hypothetical protein KDE22_04015 [Rhodobacterales bacterium]|nr:hypothetical protein [Rhodobacterales bacterium]